MLLPAGFIAKASDHVPEELRFGENTEFNDASWTEVTLEPPDDRRKGLKRYRFRIPLDGSSDAGDTVQLQVKQLDRFSNTRTVTSRRRRALDACRPASGAWLDRLVCYGRLHGRSRRC